MKKLRDRKIIFPKKNETIDFQISTDKLIKFNNLPQLTELRTTKTVNNFNNVFILKIIFKF